MLVAGQHEIEVQLAAEAAGLIFGAVGQRLAGFQIALKAAVVDEHGDVAERLHRVQRGLGGGNRLLDDQLFHRLGVLPAADKVRAHADQTDAQAVFQPVHGVGRDGQAAFPVADVGTEAERVEVGQVIHQRVHAVVEIVVAQRHKLIARQIHHRRDGVRAVGILAQAGGLFLRRKALIQVGQRRALNGVAAVDDQRVAVVRVFAGQLHQPHRAILHVGVIGGIEIAVGIGGVANGECSSHANYCPLASLPRIRVEANSMISMSTIIARMNEPTIVQRRELMH